jgi:hypothetical protein
MFNPAYLFVLNEDEDRNHELIIKQFLDLMSIACLSFIACGFYGLLVALQIPEILNYLWCLFWNTLSPGRQWLELAFLLSSLAASISMIILINSIVADFDKKIEKMNKNLEEKEKEIAALESIIEKTKEK